MDPSDRVEQLQNETLEEEETSSTITKELQFPISQSFVTTFFGRPQEMSLLCCFDFFQNSDFHLLRLCFKMEEDNQQEDASFDLMNKSFHSVFTFNLNLHNINTIQKPRIKKKQWQCFQKHYRNKHDGSTRQHGLAVMFSEGDEKVFYVRKPIYPMDKNPDYPDGAHVEQLLIEDIKSFLQQNENDKGPKVKFIMIYTYNSPCFKGKKIKIDGCMFQLSVMAQELYRKYGILTYVLFTEYWGPIGRRSPILRDLSDLHKQHITFRLDSTKITENLNKIKQLLSMSESDFQKAKDELIELSKSDEPLTTQQHLVRGKEVIAFLKDQKIIYDSLSESWKASVENSLKKNFTAVCNTVQVKCFIENLKSILGNSSPIRFYQIPQSLLM